MPSQEVGEKDKKEASRPSGQFSFLKGKSFNLKDSNSKNNDLNIKGDELE